MLIGSAAQAVTLSAFIVTHSELGLLAASAAFGIGFSGLIPANVLAVRELFPVQEASWRIPTLLLRSGTGMGTGVWLAGALYDYFGYYGPAFGAGVAWMIAGWGGAALAVLGMSAPAGVIAVLLTTGYELWKQNGTAMSAIAGILAASVGLMAASAWQLVGPQLGLRNWRQTLRALTFAGGALLLAQALEMHPVQVLLLAGAVGFWWQEPS